MCRVAGAAVGVLILCGGPAVQAQVVQGVGAYGSSGGLASPLETTTPPREGTRAQAARTRPFDFRISAEETFTDNVNLEPSDVRTSDFVTRIAPGVQLNYSAARVRVQGSIDLPILLYARTSERNNRVQPRVDVTGHVEAIENLFFVDASAEVTQSYFNPFGPTSPVIENNPQNAYTSHSYRVSPYLRYANGDYSYELRDNNTWTDVSNTPISTSNAYSNELLALVRRNPAPVGWSADYRRDSVDFGDSPQTQVIELSRLSLLVRPDRELELSASVGYEENRFTVTSDHGMIYGAGARWRPNDRMRLDASWEQRLFGPSYHFRLEDRTPLVVWNVEASRQITSFPQLLAELPSGSVPALLDSLFSSRIPDATERQQFVQDFIDARGLPQSLTGPLALYSRNIQLEERLSASISLIGARNTVFLHGYRARTEPLAGAEFVGTILNPNTNVTQTGASIVWTHVLDRGARLSLSYDQRYVKPNEGGIESTHESSLNALLSVLLTRKTRLFGGLRFQRQRSELSRGYDEHAAFAGVTYTFH